LEISFFFRDLGVSINELKNLSSMELEDLSRLLEENEVKLDGRIAALEETKQKIRKKRHMIAEIGRLRANSFTLCSPDFEKVIADPLFENKICHRSGCYRGIPSYPRSGKIHATGSSCRKYNRGTLLFGKEPLELSAMRSASSKYHSIILTTTISPPSCTR
jgi:hypothetical protein